MLLDSDASGNFLRSSIVDGAHESLQINSVSPKKINLANGSSLTTNQVIPNVSTEVQGKLVQSTFIILPELSNSYDAILGMPYLESADPLISFKSKTIRWQNNPKSSLNNKSVIASSISGFELAIAQTVKHAPTAIKASSKAQPQIIRRTTKQIGKWIPKRLNLANIRLAYPAEGVKLEKGDQLLLVRVQETDDEQQELSERQTNETSVDEIIPTLHPDAQKLVTEFKSVFPDQLPKSLPPKRNLEHTIDLVPNAPAVSQPIYRMSQFELQELKRQIDDLLAHGFIRPSLSS